LHIPGRHKTGYQHTEGAGRHNEQVTCAALALIAFMEENSGRGMVDWHSLKERIDSGFGRV